ncbi:MAG TPA: SpoIIE family protein phosphatase [Acidobacteriaceae bacterium]|nr:SpoIIE family protein phosphatase [Acidobacteriaceae bacterium]
MRSEFVRHRFYGLISLLFLLSTAHLSLRAQTQLVLGNSAVELTGPWKFHTGDDMRWADPNFDDSGWGTMDLTPASGSTSLMYGTGGFVPGWTKRGYPGYSGFAWYRLRVNIQNAQDARAALALKMPAHFDDAYQVYVNGQRIGQFGRFTSHGVTFYLSQPSALPLPDSIRRGPVTIAIRMWMDAATPFIAPDVGGLHGPPVLGQPSYIQALLRQDWEDLDRALNEEFLLSAILLQVLLVAFGLYWLDRSEQAYLWLCLVCAISLFYSVVVLLGYYTTWIGQTPVEFFEDVVLIPAYIGLWVLFWGYWFRLERMARLHRVVWGLVLVLAVGMAMLRPPLYGRAVPVQAILWLLPFTEVFKLLLGAMLVWVTYRGIRRDRTEGLLALPAVALVFLSLYQEDLMVLHIPVSFFPFGFGITLSDLATMLSLGIITVLLLRRFVQDQRERERIRTELQQARSVQEMLIPKHTPQIPGFAVESVYLPASEVGGDFFQVLPGDDGSLLVVVGDVSGKGLKAAMTVSTIIGALRGCCVHGPAEVLAYLNHVLHGQISGFVTCCAARIAADGAMTLANAGNPAPYCNGEEMTVGVGLPLGILDEGSYEETHYQLAANDRLTFVSDGVVEATNEKRELFGFERTQAISHQPAQAIAEAAKQFGQEDDISVLSVIRTATMKAAIA